MRLNLIELKYKCTYYMHKRIFTCKLTKLALLILCLFSYTLFVVSILKGWNILNISNETVSYLNDMDCPAEILDPDSSGKELSDDADKFRYFQCNTYNLKLNELKNTYYIHRYGFNLPSFDGERSLLSKRLTNMYWQSYYSNQYNLEKKEFLEDIYYSINK